MKGWSVLRLSVLVSAWAVTAGCAELICPDCDEFSIEKQQSESSEAGVRVSTVDGGSDARSDGFFSGARVDANDSADPGDLCFGESLAAEATGVVNVVMAIETSASMREEVAAIERA